MKSSFFADLDEEIPLKQSTSSFFSDLQDKKPINKKARLAAQYGIGLAERAAAPYDIAVSPLSSKKAQQVPYRENIFQDIERLQEKKQMGDWDENDQNLYDFLVDQIKNPEEADKFVKTFDISSSGLIEKAGKKLGYNLEPEDAQELGARITGNIFTPKGLAKGVKQATKLLNKEYRQASKLQSQWKKLDISSKGNPEKENILNFAKSKNLTPEESTVLLRTHGSIKTLESLAKKNKKYKQVASGLKDKLGNSYDQLKYLGKQSGLLTESEKGALQGDLQKTLNKIGKTFVEGPDTKAARLEIEEAIKKIGANQGTIEDLINSRQNLNQVVNWKNVDPKEAILKEVDNSLFNAIQRKNPEIASELKKVDTAYSKYKTFSKNLDKKQPFFKFGGVEIPGLMGKIAFGTALTMSGLGTKAALGVGVKEAVQRMSTKLLTDPKYYGISKRIRNAVMQGSTEKQKSLFLVLKQMLKKDDPELYDEVSELTFD